MSGKRSLEFGDLGGTARRAGKNPRLDGPTWDTLPLEMKGEIFRRLASDKKGLETLLKTMTPEERPKFGKPWTDAAEWGARGTTHLGDRFSPGIQRTLAGAHTHLPRLKFTIDSRRIEGDPVPVTIQDKFVALCSVGETESASALLGRDDVDLDKISLRLGLGQARNALMSAALGGHADTVRMLIDAGAEVDASNDYGTTALMFAAMNGSPEVVDALIGKDAETDASDVADMTALMLAAQNGNMEVAIKLVEYGAEINRQDYYDTTVLMHAAKGGNAELVAELIRRGAEIGARGLSSKTVLMYAAEGGNAELVAGLIGLGADIGAVDSGGRTALMCAAENGKMEAAGVLIERGADVNAADKDHRQTALMLASYFGFAGTVSLLIQSGANVKAVDRDRKTALHYACRKPNFQNNVPGERSQLPVVKLLLDNGAEINARDYDGYTPLQYCEDRDLSQYMRERGARL